MRSKPPTNWSQFLAACKKLQAAGITPLALGLKDGFGGEILGSAERFYPGRLPELLPAFLAGEAIDEPFEFWN